MDEDKIILYAGLAIGGYILYKKFFKTGVTPSEGAGLMRKAPGSESHVTTPEEKASALPYGVVQNSSVISSQTDWLGYKTTYFWTQAELNKINPVQKFLLNIGIPVGVLFR